MGTTTRFTTLAFLLLPVLIGCEIPSQIVWSPDGKRAAYLSTVHEKPNSVAVLDEKGAIVAKLGPATGGLAWSADSKRLYFSSVQTAPTGAKPFEIREGWANAADALPPEATTRPSKELPKAADPQQPGEEKDEAVISVWEDGAARPLFWLESTTIWHLRLSPDQKWLALMTYHERHDDNTRDQTIIYAFSLDSHRLYPLSVADMDKEKYCKGMCFTGPSRLAFVEPIEVVNGVSSEIGTIAEVELDVKAEKLERRTAAVVLRRLVAWMEPAGEDILFTGVNVSLPMVAGDVENLPPHKLMRWVRAEGKLKVALDDVGELFAPSPDGQRVLLEKITPAANKEDRTSDFAVWDMRSGTVQTVCALPLEANLPDKPHAGIPAYPVWRGNDEITFVDWTKPPVQQNDRAYFDLVLYQLTDKLELKPVRTLSETWPTEMKPSFSVKEDQHP